MWRLSMLPGPGCPNQRRLQRPAQGVVVAAAGVGGIAVLVRPIAGAGDRPADRLHHRRPARHGGKDRRGNKCCLSLRESRVVSRSERRQCYRY